MNSIMILAGRILISAIFIVTFFGDIGRFAAIAERLSKIGMPIASFLLACAMALKLLGGLSVLCGFKTRIGTILLIGFMIPATLLFHFALSDYNQLLQFLKNAALIAGLIFLFILGPGQHSIDNRHKKAPAHKLS